MAYIILSALAVLLAVNTANGIVCYNCNSKDSERCKWGFTSFTYSTEECAKTAVIDSILPAKCFKITATNKDGKDYIARGCLPAGTFGCSAMAKAVGWLSSTTSDDGDSLQNLSCETCETDKCNSADRFTGFTLVGLVLSAFVFML
ncbi:unnamed protein product [Phaedon cochleariae]|uniref:Protein sleepless n=1 Tax=Phaedon cochleariae TaxID=80249 RepID=A0A9P0D8C9_PHACE|nr:unnamed protein product [Phaedon cochleariae]